MYNESFTKEITMLTKQDLLEAGYKPFKSKVKLYTDQGYQKRFDDEKGKRYFITVWEYDNREFQDRAPALPDFSYAPDSQFDSNGVTFDVNMIGADSVEHMEAFFERTWSSMDCDYYEKWSEA